MLFICTYGRALNQVTWKQLPATLQRQTRLVVQDREKHLYPQYPVIVLPPGILTIGPTRQFLVENYGPKIVMMDDDLTFATRRWDDPTRFRESNEGDIVNMYGSLLHSLDLYAHAGIASREGGNRNTEAHIFNTRMMRVLAYDTELLRRENIRFDAVELMEDFHVTLSLLRLGYENVVNNLWVHNQSGSNSAGGCSTYRTDEKQTEAARKLAELHAPFVKVVQKHTKTAWGGKERTDVVIQWKRAYDSHTDSR